MCNLLPPYLSLLVQKRRGWWMCGICLMKKGFFLGGGGGWTPRLWSISFRGFKKRW